tara:strand:+ start:863 stop:1111 length:249 start_codon:yes stop_codon:yes gene_type:complete
MKLTKSKLKQIIKEELAARHGRLNENFKGHDPLMISYIDNIKQAILDGQQEGALDRKLGERILAQVANIYARYRQYEEEAGI